MCVTGSTLCAQRRRKAYKSSPLTIISPYVAECTALNGTDSDWLSAFYCSQSEPQQYHYSCPYQYGVDAVIHSN